MKKTRIELPMRCKCWVGMRGVHSRCVGCLLQAAAKRMIEQHRKSLEKLGQ
jgi:hypothetical protein